MKLLDRVAVVTGGGSGIGRAICLLFATQGARVIVNDNNAGIASAGLSDRPGLRERMEARIKEVGSGQGIRTHLDATEGIDDASWRRMLAVHLDGTFYCTREALRLMKNRGRGAIVNLSSVAALSGLATVPHYSAAKGGILAFTRAVAQDVASRGIRVNAICPCYIDTPMTEPGSPL